MATETNILKDALSSTTESLPLNDNYITCIYKCCGSIFFNLFFAFVCLFVCFVQTGLFFYLPFLSQIAIMNTMQRKLNRIKYTCNELKVPDHFQQIYDCKLNADVCRNHYLPGSYWRTQHNKPEEQLSWQTSVCLSFGNPAAIPQEVCFPSANHSSTHLATKAAKS